MTEVIGFTAEASYHRDGERHGSKEPGMEDGKISFAGAGPATGAAASSTLDVRGLEPPLPMMQVLRRLDTLPPGETLVVLHDRRPRFLYPQLEERGFVHETDESGPGLVRIAIRRRAAWSR
jgi:tRNA 2-thiouridine synthesizing protein A